jgi:hypothetical protein
MNSLINKIKLKKYYDIELRDLESSPRTLGTALVVTYLMIRQRSHMKTCHEPYPASGP